MRNSLQCPASIVSPDARHKLLLAELLKEEGVNFEIAKPIVARDRHQDLPLSSAQQRLWFVHQLEPQASYYNIPIAFYLSGTLDIVALEAALNGIIARHETLRTTFSLKQGVPVQNIEITAPFRLCIIDLQAMEESARVRHVEHLLAKDARKPFDLERGPLFRIVLYRLSPQQHTLMVNVHHIVCDAWSINIFLHELTQMYSATRQRMQNPLAELQIQYADYAMWQQEWLQTEAAKEQLAYWKQQLCPIPPVLELPGAKRRPAVNNHAGAQHHFEFSEEEFQGLREIVRAEHATLFTVLLTAFYALLYRYTGQEDIVVGTPIAGRIRVETEPLIGCFLNMAVLRTRLPETSTFSSLLRRTREMVLNAYSHQDLPFERIVEELQPERDLGHMPFVQVAFTLVNVATERWVMSGTSIRQEFLDSGDAKSDLSLSIAETQQGLGATMTYLTGLFDAELIRAMERHLRVLMRRMIEIPDRKIVELSLLSLDEQHKIICEWNHTEIIFSHRECLHHCVEDQVRRTPLATAVVFEGRQLTFCELDNRANQLAHYLRKYGIGLESRVAICMERSLEMVFSLLAVLKAGAAYVPLDPDYPQQRLAVMLDDAAPPAVLTQQHLVERLPLKPNRTIICVDREWDAIAQQPLQNPGVPVSARNAAYVIYTSGSTGLPKGVMNEHHAVVNHSCWLQHFYPLTSADRVMQKTPYTFDVSVPEFFRTLMNGACLIVARPGGHRDPAYMVNLIMREKITTIRFVPSMLQLLLEAEGLEECASLKTVICTGEIVSVTLQERFFERFKGVRLINAYGPTEAAVEVTLCECRTGTSNVPIGGPGSNTQIYILNQYFHPLPIGIAGELFIGGVQVARGYLNRPDLTAEKFIPDPFSLVAGQRIYRTGDLARWQNDGTADFLGRIDHQVKLRGFRIELGEIEAVLMQYPALREAVVMVRQSVNGEKHLVAYVTPREGHCVPGASELKAHLQQKLPDYMIPSAFVALDFIPVNSSGKVDRKLLPAVEIAAAASCFVPPSGPVQELVAAIWAQMLNLPRVGIHDNFFDLGGHSLLAIRTLSRIRDAFQVEIPVQAIFTAPSIADLARIVDQQREGGPGYAEIIPAGASSGDLPLSYNQEGRLLLEWFSAIRGVRQPPFHATFGLQWIGDLNVEQLENAINQIIQRHETLRTAFPQVKGKTSLELLSELDPIVRRHGMQGAMHKLMELAPRYFKQVICPSTSLSLTVRSLHEWSPAERETEIRSIVSREAQTRFNYERPPLMRATLLRMSDHEHCLIITLHHLIADVWSVNIFIQELAIFYQRLNGKTASLPELSIQHSDYAAWQRKKLQGERLAALTSYWRFRWAEVGLLDIKDLHLPGGSGKGSAVESLAFDAALCRQVNAFARQQGLTNYMLFLGALNLLLFLYSGKNRIGVWANFANRDRTETENLIGWFTNSHLIGVEIAPDQPVSWLLAEVRDVVLQAHAHQEIPYSLLWANALQDLNVQHHSHDEIASPFIMFDFQTKVLNMDTLGLQIRLAALPLQPIQLALQFLAWQGNDDMGLSIHYATQLLSAPAVRQLLNDFRKVLESIISKPEVSVSSFAIWLRPPGDS
jgi:amino acid adenylation domain-containing protein